MGNVIKLLVSDEGFRGMIIQIGKNFQAISVKDTVIEVQAGALLSRTARAAWNAGLTGFEFAAGIPGSVGGAVAMNAGAYGGEVKDVLLDAEVLTQEGEFLRKTTLFCLRVFHLKKVSLIRLRHEWMSWPKPEERNSL